MPARITGSASIDTLVRVGLEKERLDLGHTTPMIVLHDFEPCVDDEVAVKKGDHVLMLYKERDWAYIIAPDKVEGFIPAVYCTPITSQQLELESQRHYESECARHANNIDKSDTLDSDGVSRLSDSLLNVSTGVPFNKITYGRYIVLFTFEAEQEDDICVRLGHFVTVLNRDDVDWFWIQRADGQEGFVPSSYLCPAEGQLSGLYIQKN